MVEVRKVLLVRCCFFYPTISNWLMRREAGNAGDGETEREREGIVLQLCPAPAHPNVEIMPKVQIHTEKA